MDIFEYAMKMEKDGEAYYRQLAKQVGKILGAVFTMLADEEVKHYDAIEAMQVGDCQMRDRVVDHDREVPFSVRNLDLHLRPPWARKRGDRDRLYGEYARH